MLHVPGHADGHLALVRDGVLIAGDALLASITPNVGLYPDSRPDPLADYLSSLELIERLSPRVAYGGHGVAIEDPAGRARELISHHHHRLEQTAHALGEKPQTAYACRLRSGPRSYRRRCGGSPWPRLGPTSSTSCTGTRRPGATATASSSTRP